MKIIKQAVPTNIITGFLGVGKSTAIQHLLSHKPEGEIWAVLVNEFGEVGIDGNMLRQNGDNKQLYIKEVPGGCMCCTSGLPMQIALNLLLAQSKPDRLLIEPTGLGHPLEVLQSLSAEHYRGILDLRQTLTLVDARKAKDKRYSEHPIFRQQIQVADRLVANKSDLYQPDDPDSLKALAMELGYQGEITSVTQGQLEPNWLQGKAGFGQSLINAQRDRTEDSTEALEALSAPDTGFIRRQARADGFYSCGWVFAPSACFNFTALMSLLLGLDMQRVKAIMYTDKGWFVFNQVDGVLSTSELTEGLDSRLECISDSENEFDSLEQALQQVQIR
ncbi:CobW family GTP-binding protein [Lacimicrobium alkaliphilum]|uniref:CobW/HypB/UreG nucleotide-binding domain-containing protein n=1 Tax=Lacimicrobium alkaliphilum TaxID=1526571 RepID=A0ABQ1RD73_9ALTE|nr:GTP-binding protein [Lacimicrobium alkaliphilum]GGD64070.1 hypothetical protein GCM10011357_19310 [Lacimicrobium alkaliphilum]